MSTDYPLFASDVTAVGVRVTSAVTPAAGFAGPRDPHRQRHPAVDRAERHRRRPRVRVRAAGRRRLRRVDITTSLGSGALWAGSDGALAVGRVSITDDTFVGGGHAVIELHADAPVLSDVTVRDNGLAPGDDVTWLAACRGVDACASGTAGAAALTARQVWLAGNEDSAGSLALFLVGGPSTLDGVGVHQSEGAWLRSDGDVTGTHVTFAGLPVGSVPRFGLDGQLTLSQSIVQWDSATAAVFVDPTSKGSLVFERVLAPAPSVCGSVPCVFTSRDSRDPGLRGAWRGMPPEAVDLRLRTTCDADCVNSPALRGASDWGAFGPFERADLYLDSDLDGLLDDWELAQAGDLDSLPSGHRNCTASLVKLDLDGDCVSDIAESNLGTLLDEVDTRRGRRARRHRRRAVGRDATLMFPEYVPARHAVVSVGYLPAHG